MRTNLVTLAILFLTSTPSIAIPQPVSNAVAALLTRDETSISALNARDDGVYSNSDVVAEELWKRKGGGSGGGKGGGTGGGSSSSGSGSSSSGSGSSGSGSGSSGSGSGSSGSGSGSSGSGKSGGSGTSGKGSSSSNSGGSTKQGSGVQPSYGGGRYYGGGSTTPYSSGARSPLGITPLFLGVGALAVFPGLWLYGAYSYPYYHPYTFYNRTGHRNSTTTRRDVDGFLVEVRQDTTTGANETKAVQCLCALYAECGCDDNGNTTFLDSLIGDGTYSALNHSLVNVVDFPNGTSIIAINGTLENGTTIAGGTEDANAGVRIAQLSGYWVMVALVGCTVLMI